jgi:hypothetical protein
MSGIKNPVVPVGSTVLITGVNGLIGSHVTNQVLKAGYRVRGTVRDTQKANWAKVLFDKLYGEGMFELVEIKDLTAEGAFDKALEGTIYFNPLLLPFCMIANTPCGSQASMALCIPLLMSHSAPIQIRWSHP